MVLSFSNKDKKNLSLYMFAVHRNLCKAGLGSFPQKKLNNCRNKLIFNEHIFTNKILRYQGMFFGTGSI